jgi:hypothetical protein
MKALGLVAAFVIGAAVVWQVAFPTYTHRYRLTVSIEIDGQVHTGSSVIEIAYVGQPEIGDVGPFAPPRVRGQAPVVDLGEHGAIVAALLPGGANNRSSSAPYLAMKAYGVTRGYDAYRTIGRQSGRRDLAADNMPLLIWFENLADPIAARVVDPSALSDMLGPTARLAAAYVEITDAPIVIDIDKKLPWYADLERRQKGHGVLRRPGELQLSYDMFVGADT